MLPFSGAERSFSELVRRFGGDVPAGAMRTEMKRVGVVVEGEDGALTVTRRAFEPESKHQMLLTVLVHGAYAFLSNVARNTDPEIGSDGWPYRIAFTQALRHQDKTQLRRITKVRISEFAESVDDVFMAFEALHASEDPASEQDAIAVGVFYFEETDPNANYDW